MDQPMPAERAAMLTDYAAGKLPWARLRQSGFPNYLDVLGGLAELGLHVPIAPTDGLNSEARSRGRSMLGRAIQASAV